MLSVNDARFSGPAALSQGHVAGAKLLADRVGLLREIARPNLRFAEIGVDVGDFSDAILRIVKPACFDAYDIFRYHQTPVLLSRLDGMNHREFYERRFADHIQSGVVRVIEGDSADCLSKQPDQFYDVIYIDGDHSPEGVRRDVGAALLKIKPSGMLIFNDYTMSDYLSECFRYGVVQAVNDLCVNGGWRIAYFALHPHMFCDVALKRPS